MRRINTIIPLQAMGERMEEVCRGYMEANEINRQVLMRLNNLMLHYAGLQRAAADQNQHGD
jgi:hypothetical protein